MRTRQGKAITTWSSRRLPPQPLDKRPPNRQTPKALTPTRPLPHSTVLYLPSVPPMAPTRQDNSTWPACVCVCVCLGVRGCHPLTHTHTQSTHTHTSPSLTHSTAPLQMYPFLTMQPGMAASLQEATTPSPLFTWYHPTSASPTTDATLAELDTCIKFQQAARCVGVGEVVCVCVRTCALQCMCACVCVRMCVYLSVWLCVLFVLLVLWYPKLAAVCGSSCAYILVSVLFDGPAYGSIFLSSK